MRPGERRSASWTACESFSAVDMSSSPAMATTVSPLSRVTDTRRSARSITQA